MESSEYKIIIKKRDYVREIFSGIMWIYIISSTTYYISSNTVDNLLQIMCLTVMAFLCAGIVCKRGIVVNKVFFYYFSLLFVVLIPDILALDIRGFYVGISMSLPVFFGLFFYNSFNELKKIPVFLIMIPVFYGAFISIQGLVLEGIKFSGIPLQTRIAYMEKGDFYLELAEFYLGAVASWGKIAGRDIYRLYGYYSEPSKLAAFLIIPLFLSAAQYFYTKKKRFLYIALIVLAGFILTFSRAGYVAVFAACIFVILIRRKKASERIATNYDFIKMMTSVLLFLVIAILILNVSVYLGEQFPNLPFLSVGLLNNSGNATFIRPETFDTEYIFSLLKLQPYGYGFSAMLHGYKGIDTNLANAFVCWMFTGGVGAVIIVFMLMYELIFYYCVPCIKSANPYKVGVAAIFVALTVQNLSYGTWMTQDYMFIVGFLVLIRDRQIGK